MWKVEDYTNGKNKGYYFVTFDGRRVFDVFPYARDADPEWLYATITEAVRVLNDAQRVGDRTDVQRVESQIEPSPTVTVPEPHRES